jgi:hypothetical protein
MRHYIEQNSQPISRDSAGDINACGGGGEFAELS